MTQWNPADHPRGESGRFVPRHPDTDDHAPRIQPTDAPDYDEAEQQEAEREQIGEWPEGYPDLWRPATEDEAEEWAAGYVSGDNYRETENGVEVRDEVIHSPHGFTYRASQENGDQVDCAECGNPLDDDFLIVTDDEGFARHEHCAPFRRSIGGVVHIPADYPVQPIRDVDTGNPNIATCGTCHLSWDDSVSTSMTPVPAGRCPFEAFHIDED